MIPILPAFYIPNIEYIHKLVSYKEIIIEKYEFFKKQTYRTRCLIYSPNGKQMLNIPIIHLKNNEKQTISNVKIDYSENWQKQHLKSLEMAYRSSPFYEFYESTIISIYNKRWEYLFEFNLEFLNIILKILKYDVKINFTDSYKKEYLNNYLDLRNSFNAKTNIESYTHKEYFQIFSKKYSFIANLCILDLIFIKGNNTLDFLKS